MGLVEKIGAWAEQPGPALTDQPRPQDMQA